MGGRGASSGVSVKGKKYGTEYTTVFKNGNIKFIKQNDSGSIKTPMETMSKGRIYALLDKNNQIKSITQYSVDGLRRKQIDVTGRPHKIEGKMVLPHTHKGYWHDEKGTFELSKEDKKVVDKVTRLWNNFIKGK